jgi:FlaA1/EpsC-like NDP-sugar epimerase/lipopolysaccharide/colanic/teichoic acid biosynthesis glycosyltransferase
MGLQKARRILFLTLGYAAVVQVAYLAALLVRFEGSIPPQYGAGYLRIAPVFTALSLLGYLLSGLYHGVWRYASTVTAFQVFKGVTLSAASLALIMFFTPVLLFPRSVILLVWLWQLVLLGGLRFAWRISSERLLEPEPRRYVRVLVVGADHAGVHLIQEMRRGGEQSERLRPIGFIDDDARLMGSTIEGVKVVGAVGDLPRLIPEKRIEMVVISDSGIPGRVVRQIASYCAEANVVVKTVPAFSSLQHGKTALSQIRDVRIEDLLGREPVHLDLNEVGQFLRGQRILVTGAGGSIGAELARQSAAETPAELVLLDHSENGLYYVQNEIAALHPDVPLHAVVADIRDADGMRLAFERYRPTVVFHAAAHKHVPLLEAAPREAVFNNIVGTRNLVEAAERSGVGKFVFISTDKAVNPSSVMGASKRVGEMILQARSQRSKTRFMAVRFGNVLGSEGSVVPLFQRQIQRGGPVTVTHPETRRYFMTIPEAVRLVIQAGAIGKGGEVMLLDMGEQVRIIDLARQLIRLSGLREGHDIEIVFTGLRPGEKLYEELHSDEERMRMTRNQRILVWDLDSRDEGSLRRDLEDLERVARTGDAESIKEALHRIVPEYVERVHDPQQAVPATPVVSLPVAVAPSEMASEQPKWSSLRTLIEGAIALALLVLSAPLWGLLWLEAQRAQRGPILVHEQRIGRTRRGAVRRDGGGGAPPGGIERRARNLMGESIHCIRFRDDLGRVSRWVWRRRLDRLPFLLNVIRGEMALVGPNPERDEVVARGLELPDYERRFRVLPGITGLAQVSGCGADDVEGMKRRIQYDLYYVDHQSFLLDLRTLIRTIGVLAGAPRRGANPDRSVVETSSTLKSVTP